MFSPVLETKLHFPQSRPDLVARPQLLERLDTGLQGVLTLVSAPAGFGKTTLVSTWLSQRVREEGSADGYDKFTSSSPAPSNVAWFSLDDGDDDPVRFLTYLVATVQKISPHIGHTVQGILQDPQLPSPDLVVTLLINDITTAETPFVLVLDDYHVITSPLIHQGLVYLVDHMPSQMHLVITSRSEPPLPLSRLRARGLLTEIGIEDLRFSGTETAVFLNRTMGLGLSPEDVTILGERTEGWITGIQLAALSLQKHADHHGFVETFTGSHRYVLDYLADEVLNHQTDDIRHFLYQTSILNSMSGPLCNAVTGREDSQAMLESLEAANLFIIPIDNERRWFRYHQLFADLLRQRLQQAFPGKVKDLHNRAANWYREEALIQEAIRHALRAENYELAADLIEEEAISMLMRVEIHALVSWLQSIPGSIIYERPWLNLVYAWILLINATDSAEVDVAEVRFRQVESALQRGEEEGGIWDYVIAFRAYLAGARRDFPTTVQLSNQALDILPEDKMVVRSVIALNLGMAYLLHGDIRAALHAFEEADASGTAAGNLYTAWASRDQIAILHSERGQLRRAAELHQQAIQRITKPGGRPIPYAGKYYVELAEIHREWNALDKATDYLETGLGLLLRQQQFEGIRLVGNVVWARVLQAQGDGGGALERIGMAEEMLQETEEFILSSWVAAVKTRLHLLQGDLAAASRWAQECGLDLEDENRYRQHPGEYTTLARVLIAQEDPDVLRLLANMHRVMESDGRTGRVIELLALQALAHHTVGEAKLAKPTLQAALALGEPEGYQRVFLDEGEAMANLLEKCPPTPYRDGLLAAFGKGVPESAPTEVTLVEPLTPREEQILKLIAVGLSNQEIADELYLTLSTVKWYTSMIYSKLGVRRRTEAAERGRELGIL